MPAVYLGKINIHWCSECDIPLVEKGECGICSNQGVSVKVTPPGDVRPAFDKDIELIRKTIDKQWGDGYSEHVLPEDKIVLLNNSPNIDRMDEVIYDGKVRGILRYSLDRKLEGKDPYVFILRPWKGLPEPKKRYVYMDKGAVKPILNGASALAPGILDADEDLKKGDEVIVLDDHGDVLGSGPAYRDGKELVRADKGRGIKVRWRVSDDPLSDEKRTWDDVIEANRGLMGSKVDEAKEFILSKIDEHDVPYAVSYSGGKDSLAVLHLVMDAGLEPTMMFVDTGIEFSETIENVHEVADEFGLDLLEADSKDGYWSNVEHFGPSARDYRWCCKTCKLGPTALLIKDNFPKGVLSFIGQRRYESENRMEHGDTWTNPWVPGQIGTSPIQDWTALHVWLYLFMKEANYNPWYERGFERIGCWVCPASDLSELEMLKEGFQGYHRFEEMLEEYREANELPEEWVSLGLWRWLDLPKDIDVDISGNKPQHIPKKEPPEEDHPILTILGNDRNSREVHDLLLRVEYCSGCGVCVAACPQGALYIEEGINILEDECVSCGRCMDKCPVIEYKDRSSIC